MSTLTLLPPRPTDRFMATWCPECCPLGMYEDGRVRLAALTQPTAVRWNGTSRFVSVAYDCTTCGHHWSQRRRWTAEHLGLAA